MRTESSMSVHVVTPIRSVNVVGDPSTISYAPSEREKRIEALEVELDAAHVDLERLKAEKAELLRACQAMEDAAAEFKRLQQDVFTEHREQIARLSVEIARRVLVRDIESGHYEIEQIIQEALRTAPSQENAVVRLNPADLKRLNASLQEQEENPFANVTLQADPKVGPAQCVVETHRGIVEFFIEQHLQQIEDALKGMG